MGGAPHKPVLLLALIRAFDFGIYKSEQIPITPELIGYFKTYWATLVKTGHKESFVLPFYHLKGERSGFWKLVAKPGYQFALTSSNSIKSFKALTDDILDYALIDHELAELLKDRVNRNILTEVILSTYFPGNKISAVEEIKEDYFKEVQTRLFNEPEEYIERVKELYGNKKGMDEELELETFSRGEAFKREIPKIYNYTCAITGMRIDSVTDVSMVDACHIVPFSISFDDSLTNGIALCPNMHRAFDRGLIAIDDDYRVMVSKNFMETFSALFHKAI